MNVDRRIVIVNLSCGDCLEDHPDWLYDFPHGVWFVPLDSLFDPLLVPQTVASTFNLREGADRPIIEIRKQALRGNTLLLILDNCEHLLDACAQLITILLTHCPNLRVLTTSREVLKVDGEATYYLPLFRHLRKALI